VTRHFIAPLQRHAGISEWIFIIRRGLLYRGILKQASLWKGSPMFHKFAPLAVLAPLVAGCVPFPQTPERIVAPEQAALVEATCRSVMGLPKGEVYYDLCQESLQHSLAGKTAAIQTEQSYDQCRQKGLKADSAAFSACVLQTQDASPSPHPVVGLQNANLVYPADLLQSEKSYFSVTPSVRWQRERYSCAQLGLAPASAAFGHCVASLDAAMFPDPN
jgi:hypothetical protein